MPHTFLFVALLAIPAAPPVSPPTPAPAAKPAIPQDDPEPPYRPRRYSSPKAVFDGYMAANKRRDYRAAYDCYTVEAQKDNAAFAAHQMLYVKKVGNFSEEFKKSCKPLFDVLEKHGVTDKVAQEIEINKTHLKLPEQTRLTLRKVIKNPAQFLIDFSLGQEKAFKLGFGAKGGKIEIKLTDLEVKEDRATATMVTSSSRTHLKQRIEFVKSDAGWKMIPTLSYEAVNRDTPDK